MRILVVAATAPEIAPLLATLTPRPGGSPRLASFARACHDVDVLTTGVGMVATAAWCSGLFARRRYDLAVNVGVCGSFRRSLAPGAVVHVVSDVIAEMGVEDGSAFVPLRDVGLLGDDEFPYRAGKLSGTPPDVAALRSLPQVHGITVNTVHGEEASIARVVERLDPDVESMEGAAFFYACLLHDIPCAQVRAVSNVVERRNRAAWKLPEAIGNLAATVVTILDSL